MAAGEPHPQPQNQTASQSLSLLKIYTGLGFFLRKWDEAGFLLRSKKQDCSLGGLRMARTAGDSFFDTARTDS